MNTNEYRKTLIILSLSFFTVAMFFDLIVSITVSKINLDMFVRLERARELVDYIVSGKIPVELILSKLTPFVILPGLYSLEMKLKKDWIDYALMVAIILTGGLGLLHLEGGLSWWGI